MFQALKKKTTVNLDYSTKLSFIIEEEINAFHNKQKLKEFMTTKPELHKIFKGPCTQKKIDTTRKQGMGKSNHHNNNEMTGNTYLSMLAMNVNGLKSPNQKT
jgi:hypothetical protein